jgi:pimeloyl-ACP methyl ester carboxylesterase
MNEGFVRVDEGIDLYNRCAGTGPSLTLVPNGIHLERDFQPLTAGRRLVFYDVRNRGRSTTVTEESQLTRGIHNDVDDLDRLRQHFEADQIDVIGHSYAGVIVLLYALRHPPEVRRLVAIGTMGPRPAAQYGPPLSYRDTVMQSVFARLGDLETQRESLTPTEFCERFWTVLREIYVTNPADAARIKWSRCNLPNEFAFRAYWTKYLLPSLNALALTEDEMRSIAVSTLLVHGTKDRSAPLGGAREWASGLPNARLVEVENAGHAPWIEGPGEVFEAIQGFLA